MNKGRETKKGERMDKKESVRMVKKEKYKDGQDEKRRERRVWDEKGREQTGNDMKSNRMEWTN